MKQVSRLFICAAIVAIPMAVAAHSGKTTPVMAELAAYHESLMKNAGLPIDTKQLLKLLHGGGDSKTASATFKAAVPDAVQLGVARTAAERLAAYASLVAKLAVLHGHHDESGTHVFYCPMANKKWVAKGKQIRNPYLADMRTCGSIVEP